MAKSIKEIGKKAEDLIEQGNEAKQNVSNCQSSVASANAGVASARRQLAAASRTDENGNPVGDVAAAQARLRMAENQLAASQRALDNAKNEVERINRQKQSQVSEISRHNETSKHNLEKLRRLRSLSFGENANALEEGIASRINEAEDSRVRLLESMGIEANADYVDAEDTSSGSQFQGVNVRSVDVSGDLWSHQGGGGGASEGMNSGGVAAPVGGGLNNNGSVNPSNSINAEKATGVNESQKSSLADAGKLSADRFPPEFTSSPIEADNTKKLVDYVNSIVGSDQRVINLYNSLSSIEKLDEHGIDFRITHLPENMLERNYVTENGKERITDFRLNIPLLSGSNTIGQIQTTLHEDAHLLDALLMSNVEDLYGDFFAAANPELQKAVSNSTSLMSSEISDLFREHDKKLNELRDLCNRKYSTLLNEANNQYYIDYDYDAWKVRTEKIKTDNDREFDYHARNLMSGGVGQLQDIYDALSGGTLRDSGKISFGHGSTYFTSQSARIAEIFANYASLSVTRPDLVALLNKDKPELVSALNKTIDLMNERVVEIGKQTA